MLSFGRDEDGELTGCGFAAGFCTDISLPASDPVRSFTRRSPSASPPVLPLEPIQTGFSSVLDAAFPLSGGHFRTSDRPSGPAAGNAATRKWWAACSFS